MLYCYIVFNVFWYFARQQSIVTSLPGDVSTAVSVVRTWYHYLSKNILSIPSDILSCTLIFSVDELFKFLRCWNVGKRWKICFRECVVTYPGRTSRSSHPPLLQSCRRHYGHVTGHFSKFGQNYFPREIAFQKIPSDVTFVDPMGTRRIYFLVTWRILANRDTEWACGVL